jgi:hypothetical protein
MDKSIKEMVASQNKWQAYRQARHQADLEECSWRFTGGNGVPTFSGNTVYVAPKHLPEEDDDRFFPLT